MKTLDFDNFSSFSLKDIKIDKSYINEIIKNNDYNKKIIANYYKKLGEDFDLYSINNKIVSLEKCNSFWLLDKYDKQKIKDFKRTNLCRDKFCNNCKKVKQASRMARFIPYIEKFKDNYGLYLLTLTIPNCSGDELKSNINNIFKCFYSLNRYFNGEKRIRGLDFNKFGYVGSLRSLEVTFNGDSYHPHLHCIIALNNDFYLEKNIINTYSYSYGKLNRLFSDFEILIQKIWFLLINGVKVTKSSIEALIDGYSCTVDSISDSSYYEVFKYMTKSVDENNNIFTYDNFKTLYFALHNVRQIQGYGIFYNIKDIDLILSDVNDLYNSLIEFLNKNENPVEILESPQEVLEDKEYTYISRKKIFSYLRNV